MFKGYKVAMNWLYKHTFSQAPDYELKCIVKSMHMYLTYVSMEHTLANTAELSVAISDCDAAPPTLVD